MSNKRQVANELTAKGQSKWDEAIADARRKIADLKKSITVFQARKRVGDPWPGDSATQN